MLNDILLGRCHSYLRMLANIHLDEQLQNKFDPSDVVQQTLLTAHEKLGQFRGQTEDELFAWLRQILRNQIASVRRQMRAAKRDIGRESSLADPSADLEDWPSTEQASPGDMLVRHEELARLADGLAQLAPDQRLVVELHHLRRLTVAEVATKVGRSKAAVVGLLFRGLKNLRLILSDSSLEAS